MIPKSPSSDMLTAEQCETLVDGAIERARSSNINARSVYVDLHPVDSATLVGGGGIVDLYKGGGWVVAVESLRMPNGYRITLS